MLFKDGKYRELEDKIKNLGNKLNEIHSKTCFPKSSSFEQPKFKIGDKVIVTHVETPYTGIVCRIVEDYCYQYYISVNGKTDTQVSFSEYELKKAPFSKRKRK